MVFLINPEKYSSRMKLPHCSHHQILEPAKDITHTFNHQLRDLNAKPAADHIVGNPLYTITYDWNVERSPIFSAHIVLIEQNLLGIFRNTSDQSICQRMYFICNLHCFQYKKGKKLLLEEEEKISSKTMENALHKMWIFPIVMRLCFS
jgi:hypothetical protein